MLVESQEKHFSFCTDDFSRTAQSLPSGSKSEFQISEHAKSLFPLCSCVCLFGGGGTYIDGYSFSLAAWSLLCFTDFRGHPQHLSRFVIVDDESNKRVNIHMIQNESVKAV